VRFIFKHFAELAFVTLHEAEPKLLGEPSKAREGVWARISGGQLFLRSNLCLILQNYVYRGEVALKRNAYPGQNEVIVDADLRPLKTRSGRVCWLCWQSGANGSQRIDPIYRENFAVFGGLLPEQIRGFRRSISDLPAFLGQQQPKRTANFESANREFQSSYSVIFRRNRVRFSPFARAPG
jgi:hypothetical protein